MSVWTATILTLFPEMFPGFLNYSLHGSALSEGKWKLDVLNIRDYANGRYGSVDDTPYGGGAGMVMRADVVDTALNAVNTGTRPEIYLSPRGRRLDQKTVEELASGMGVILVCGRYEGLDERVIKARGMREISLGDFILSGGEGAAMTLMEACVRLLPDVIGKPESLLEESFTTGLLEYPHYTRPAVWQGLTVPDVLLSGHHEKIKTWRLSESKKVTRERRIDLWSKYVAAMNEARVLS